MLSELKPRQKHLVFDLVEEAGFDVTDWRASARDPRKMKANPKYCYEWSYLQPGRVVVLNLWHANMKEDDGRIVLRENFRADGEQYRTANRRPEWARRAQKIDEAIRTALRENLSVRVIVLDGKRRDKTSLDTVASAVMFRELDPEPWTITDYDYVTGATELTRGILAARYVDQFDLDQLQKSEVGRQERQTLAFVRRPEVRRRVLSRAAGRCELCGEVGFRTSGGALYLETHHIIPLAEGGNDEDWNVAALCAHDHRRAHHAEDRELVRDLLLGRLGGTKPERGTG